MPVCYAIDWRIRAPPCPREGLRPPVSACTCRCFDELFSARARGHRAQRLTRDARPGKELIVRKTLPTRDLRERPDLDQLKRQAKELLNSFRAGDADAAI